jgi:hypothetical protein
MLEVQTEGRGSGDDLGDRHKIDRSIAAIRASSPELPVMVLETSTAPHDKYADVYIATKVFHGVTVPDIASDTPAADREKMFAHEKIACGFKAPLHFTTCKRAPTLVGGFSLAIDNCLPHVDANYKDYGC